VTPQKSKGRKWLTGRSRLVVAIGVVLFLVLDVLLIGYALTRPATGGNDPLAPIPTFGATSAPTPTPTPTPPPEPLPESAPRFMVSVDGTIGWRSTAGSCPGEAAVIERTVDGGASWEHTPVDDLTVHQVLSLSGTESTVQAVARVEGGCSVDLLASFTEGDFWSQYPERVAEFSFIDPTSPSVLQIGGEATEAPCASPRELRTGSAAIGVVCDGALFEMLDGSTDWTSIAIPGLLAIAPNDTGYALAVAGVEGCAGLSFQLLPLLSEGVGPTPISCVSDVELAQVTLAQSGESVWLWGGDRVLVSQDGGATWA